MSKVINIAGFILSFAKSIIDHAAMRDSSGSGAIFSRIRR